MLTMSLTPFSVSAFSLSPMIADISHGTRSLFAFSTNPSSSSTLNSAFSSITSLAFKKGRRNKVVVSASDEIVGAPLTGVVFQPFEELKKNAFVVPVDPRVSLARQSYAEECEAGMNEQIKCVYCFLALLVYL